MDGDDAGGLLGDVIGGIVGALGSLAAAGDIPLPPPEIAAARPLIFAAPEAHVVADVGDIARLWIEEDAVVPALHLELSPPAAQAFGELTAGAIGEVLEVSICGEVVAAPMVQAAIHGGALQITLDDAAEAARLAEAIAAPVPCPEEERPLAK